MRTRRPNLTGATSPTAGITGLTGPDTKPVGIRRGLAASVSGRRPASAARAVLCSMLAAAAALAFAAPAWAGLPDNRAYEMVSPVDKGDGSRMPNLAVASPGGEHVVVDGGVTNSLLSSGASWMLENRTPTGWKGVQVGPPPGQGSTEESYFEQRSTELAAVSEDFSSFAFQTMVGIDPRDRNSPFGTHSVAFGSYPTEGIPSSDAYVRYGPTAPFMFASGPPAPAVKTTEVPAECYTEPAFCGENDAVFGGGSSDLSVVVWSQLKPMVAPPASLPGSPVDTHEHGSEVYESTNGTGQQLVGLVPASGAACGPSQGGCVVPACGAAMGDASGYIGMVIFNSFAPTAGAVSGDGSQVVFTSPEPAVEGESGCHPGEIYVREDGTSTVQASASQRTGGDPHGPRRKLYAGSAQEGGRLNTVFFTSSEELANNSNTGNEDQGNDLYAYSLKTGKLTDVSADSNPSDVNGASVISFVGSSTDGSIVYFTATGVLTSEPNSQGEKAQAEASNLYVYDGSTGTTRFIAPGAGVAGPTPVSARGIVQNVGYLTSGLTPDGRHLVFVSSEHIASYDNVGSECGGPCSEVYLYDQAGNRVVCVSCDPSGAPPAGDATLPREFEEGFFTYIEAPATLVRPRVVSDDGARVFFESPDRLTVDAPAPSPARGQGVITYAVMEPNVYEYEGGRVYLIAPAAALSTVTPSGNDVFFDTVAQLVPQDRDGSPDIYDARVNGGFPALAAPACSGTSCQGLPAPAPIFAAPPSATFNGVGNFPAPVSSLAHAKKRARKRHSRNRARHRAHGRAKRSSRHSKRGSK